MSLVIPPWTLRKWDIKFKIVLQQPGDMVFLQGDNYHCGMNLGANLAEAINYAAPDYQPCPFIVSCCDKYRGCPENIDPILPSNMEKGRLRELDVDTSIEGCGSEKTSPKISPSKVQSKQSVSRTSAFRPKLASVKSTKQTPRPKNHSSRVKHPDAVKVTKNRDLKLAEHGKESSSEETGESSTCFDPAVDLSDSSDLTSLDLSVECELDTNILPQDETLAVQDDGVEATLQYLEDPVVVINDCIKELESKRKTLRAPEKIPGLSVFIESDHSPAILGRFLPNDKDRTASWLNDQLVLYTIRSIVLRHDEVTVVDSLSTAAAHKNKTPKYLPGILDQRSF